MRGSTGFAFLLALLSATASPTQAQFPTDFTQTLPPFGGFSGSDFDIVSLQNGNLHMSIPLVQAIQRGGKTVWFKYLYDTPSYTVTFTAPPPPPQHGQAHWSIGKSSLVSDWRVVSSLDWTGNVFTTRVTCASGNDNAMTYQVQDPDGVTHPSGLVTSGGICPGNLSGPSLDGSGLFFAPAKLLLKDGSLVTEDTNGNLDYTCGSNGTTCVDTMNRPLLTKTSGPTTSFTTPLGKTANGPQYVLLQYMDSNGVLQTFRVDNEAIDVDAVICPQTLRTGSYDVRLASGPVFLRKNLPG